MFFTTIFLIILCISGIFGITALDAQTAKESSVATIRVGKHANFVRIVFSAAEEYIQNASAVLIGSNTIQVDVQHPVIFRMTGKDILKSGSVVEAGSGVTINIRGGICNITVENLDNINVSRLSSPSRFVIDAYLSQIPKETTGEKSPGDLPDTASFELFMIDAGHGGYDNGMRGRNFVEKEFVLSFAKEFAAMLSRKGKKVFLTRKGDHMLSIKDRVKAANQKSPKVFISFHLSSGNEFIVYSSSHGAVDAAIEGRNTSRLVKNIAIAKTITQNFKNEFKLNARYENLPLPVIMHVNTPAVLIELPNPEGFRYDAHAKERLMNLILNGIMGHGK